MDNFVIPGEILAITDLSLAERSLLALIYHLDNKDGCYASNAFMGKYFGFTAMWASRVITRLKDKGFISVSYSSNGEYGQQRIVKIGVGVLAVKSEKKTTKGINKRIGGYKQTYSRGINKRIPYYNNKDYNKESNTPAWDFLSVYNTDGLKEWKNKYYRRLEDPVKFIRKFNNSMAGKNMSTAELMGRLDNFYLSWIDRQQKSSGQHDLTHADQFRPITADCDF